MSHLIFIGIDPGIKLGISIINFQSEVLYTDTYNLSIDGKNKGVQYLNLFNKIIELIEWAEYKYKCVPSKDILLVYELVSRHIGTLAAHSYGAITGIVQLICAIKNIEYVSIPVKVIKKMSTGNGNASKQQMMQAVRENWNIEPIDDNSSDSLWIAECGRRLDLVV